MAIYLHFNGCDVACYSDIIHNCVYVYVFVIGDKLPKPDQFRFYRNRKVDRKCVDVNGIPDMIMMLREGKHTKCPT